MIGQSEGAGPGILIMKFRDDGERQLSISILRIRGGFLLRCIEKDVSYVMAGQELMLFTISSGHI